MATVRRAAEVTEGQPVWGVKKMSACSSAVTSFISSRITVSKVITKKQKEQTSHEDPLTTGASDGCNVGGGSHLQNSTSTGPRGGAVTALVCRRTGRWSRGAPARGPRTLSAAPGWRAPPAPSAPARARPGPPGAGGPAPGR